LKSGVNKTPDFFKKTLDIYKKVCYNKDTIKRGDNQNDREKNKRRNADRGNQKIRT
jgi:hypothetical protein